MARVPKIGGPSTTEVRIVGDIPPGMARTYPPGRPLQGTIETRNPTGALVPTPMPGTPPPAPVAIAPTPTSAAEPPFDDAVGQKEEESLAVRLKRAQTEHARQLHDATEKLNKIIFDVQSALADLKLGVAAEVHIGEEDPSGDSTWTLAFRKHEGAWCLVIDEWFEPAAERHTTPLVKASRDLRIEAMHRLPELLDELLKSSELTRKHVEEGIDAAADFIKKLHEAKS
jgi:hypothetical protein